jgi:NifU-like protein involved in Fe-S cluster formation/metal-sulfur cluster biosynthetic enzyme
MKFPYNDRVLDHFRHPRNVGRLEDPDGRAMEGSPACGDMIALWIKVDPESQRIADVRFESYGCASNIATASIITEMAKGKTLSEAKKISWKQATEELGGLPPIKAHCSVLAIEGLRAAIADYEERHGLVKERIPTTVETVESRLRHVMNPLTGLDMVRTNLLRSIRVDAGTVTVAIDLPPEHQFANALREDVVEKLEALWDVERVVVNFGDGPNH